MLNNDSQGGFTLIEIIAVLILLGFLAAVALSKYMDLVEGTKNKAVVAQFSELSGRVKVVDAKFQMEKYRRPDSGKELLNYGAIAFPAACPENSTVEGDFTFSCSGDNMTREITISFSGFQTTTFFPAITYIISN